jgi:hypothetical protein
MFNLQGVIMWFNDRAEAQAKTNEGYVVICIPALPLAAIFYWNIIPQTLETRYGTIHVPVFSMYNATVTGINAAVSQCARDRSGNTGSPAGAEELERIARS